MTTNQSDHQAAFDLLALPEHQRLLFGALKTAHVTRYHPLFEDCLTNAYLTWLDAYQHFPADPTTDLPHFRKYAFCRIKWRTYDYLRRQALRSGSQVDLKNAATLTIDPMAKQDRHWELTDLLTALLAIARPGESYFLTEFFLDEQPVTEIMRRHHVSRRTVYNWRSGLLQKARRLYERQS